MQRDTRRQSKGDLREAAILDSAFRLLGEKPMEEISIDDLVGGAGIKRSTFYFYFDSRDAVISALARNALADIRQARAALASMNQPPDVAIRLLVYGILEQWRQQGPLLRAMASRYERDPHLRAFWDEVNDELLAVLAAWVDEDREAGVARPGPPTSIDLLRALTAMVWRRGYELSLQGPTDAVDPVQADTLIEIALRSVYGANVLADGAVDRSSP